MLIEAITCALLITPNVMTEPSCHYEEIQPPDAEVVSVLFGYDIIPFYPEYREDPEPTHTHPPEPEPSHTHDEPTSVGNVWWELAICESGMNGVPRWDYNGGSGFDGGIQFHPNTWSSYRPSDYPAYAYQATPEQQIAVGKMVAETQGANAWPSCTSKLGISTEDLLQ